MDLPCIFNCSNDMALAANVRQYVPPKRIRQMEADLADLARVWEGTQFAGPWGWSLATKQRYRQMGVPEEALPTDAWLAEVRRLSSREYACGYVRELLEHFNDERLLGREMRWVDKRMWERGAFSTSKPTSGTSVDRRRGHRSTDIGDVGLGVVEEPFSGKPQGAGDGTCCEGHEEAGRWIFKLPWSSSGRGVFVTDGLDDRSLTRLRGFLSSQGGFAMDRFYAEKVLDFAMEFFVADAHRVDFLGYSVFHAAAGGAYGYNHVERQEHLLQRIGVDEALLRRLIDYHKEHLAQTVYRGPVGIDMLKTADGRIHPCLEINLRMNMGILALLLSEQYGEKASVALTSCGRHGFQALLDEGRLRIVCR